VISPSRTDRSRARAIRGRGRCPTQTAGAVNRRWVWTRHRRRIL